MLPLHCCTSFLLHFCGRRLNAKWRGVAPVYCTLCHQPSTKHCYAAPCPAPPTHPTYCCGRCAGEACLAVQCATVPTALPVRHSR